ESRKADMESLRQQTQRTESGLLAKSASALVDDQSGGDASTAVLLALEALPDKAAGNDRPRVPEAQFQLDRAFLANQEQALLAHQAGVGGAAFSADGSRVVTASLDGTARVWEAATGKELARLVHNDRVWTAAFSVDGARIVTASDDKTARVWEAATG